MKKIGAREYADLVTENRQRFYRMAYSYVKNEEEALDIVSEAVYRGYVHRKELKEADYFFTWMTRIVINTALEMIRKNRHYGYTDFDTLEECLSDQAEKGLSQEELTDLYQAIDRLSPEDRSFIILRYFENQNFREMGEILGLPENTVKSRVYRCLAKMRTYLEDGVE